MTRHIKKPQSALLLGAGFVAKHFAPELLKQGWDVTVTTRSGQTNLNDVTCLGFNGEASAELQNSFTNADLILTSIPPAKNGTDPALAALEHLNPRAEWIGYLSATSVYGDRGGKWAFEGECPTPSLRRGIARAEAEIAWVETLWPVHIFRLAGIYGLGRSPFTKLRQGTARAVIKDGHVVNRIHVADIINALQLSIANPNPQAIYNLADGHPAPPQDVLDYAAGLLQLAPPPRVDVDNSEVTKMARSFYKECKRINADKARQELGWMPKHPSYRDGLQAILDQG